MICRRENKESKIQPKNLPECIRDTTRRIYSVAKDLVLAFKQFRYGSCIGQKCNLSSSTRKQRRDSTGTKTISTKKPASSEVLTCYLKQTNFPPWTSYFVKYNSILDDQWGFSHFNWTLDGGNHNYHILRTGCYPYIKYHCTKRPYQDLTLDNTFFRFIKVLNLGIPCLAYGIAAKFLLKGKQSFTEVVHTPKGPVTIYFLYKEDKGSSY